MLLALVLETILHVQLKFGLVFACIHRLFT